jgi:hypothetical protein
MTIINDNSRMYRPGITDRTREEEQFQVFLGRILTVDHERIVCTLEDLRTKTTYQNVSVWPANSNSFESTDVQMPEEGATCLCVPLHYDGGFSQVAILSYTLQETLRAMDAIAMRPMEEVGVYNQRRRGTYRKAYQGQKTVSMASGYTEKVDEGWDKQARDLSRDYLNTYRREWTQTTSRKVNYTDAGVSFSGQVHRPDADSLVACILPDGSKEFISYLQPGAKLEDRYNSGKQDVTAFVEHTTKVQEFALDYPVPVEILQSDLLDTILGTVSDPWQRTQIKQTGDISHDDKTFLIQQDADHPYSRSHKPVGSTTAEGATPQRKGFMIEHTEGTLVGYNRFDKVTYGKVLKPVLFPATKAGRFGSDVESGYLPVEDSNDHVEARLAASAFSMRFPYEYNTTRWDVTKEGFMSFEIGATLPKENIKWAGDYEHPHGAGRSLEGHLVGSLKMVIGKNRDEEDSIDIQALGQTILRLGADDASLPSDGREVSTQMRSQADAIQARTLQYWKKAKLNPGDAGDLESKTGAENISLRMGLDGGVVARFGARNPTSKRRHLMNGYQDGQGQQIASGSSRKDSRSAGRPTYGTGDDIYRFHDLTQVGSPQVSMLPYNWSGQPMDDMDKHGLSADLHFVRDVLLRIGANPASGQSLMLDLGGGMVLGIGKDKQGRSITASLDGGAEIVIGQNNEKKGLRLEINGDVDMTVKGNMHQHITGDYILEATTIRAIAKTDCVLTAQKIIEAALTRHTTEAPEIIHNQGLYESEEDS